MIEPNWTIVIGIGAICSCFGIALGAYFMSMKLKEDIEYILE